LTAATFAVVMGCGAAQGVGNAAPVRTPSLHIIESSRLTVRGTGFKAREHVTVSVVARSTARRRVVASPSGRFTVAFSGVSPNDCAGFSISAVGNRGSRASFKRAPGQCPLP
jgi:hypothetical protein